MPFHPHTLHLYIIVFGKILRRRITNFNCKDIILSKLVNLLKLY